jgi:hypothetical protein
MQPNYQSIFEHLSFLFNGQTDGLIEIAYTPNNSGAVNKAKYFNVTQLEDAANFAFEQNSIEGVNVYVGAALRDINTAPFGRSNHNDFYKATTIWCDLDDANAAKEAKDKYKDLPPSFVVVTGRHPDLRAQVWWKLDTPQNDAAEHKKALANVCAALSGDKAVVDPARVMRLGGTIAWPKKDGRIPELTEIKTPSNAVTAVSWQSFNDHFPAAPVDKPSAVREVDLQLNKPSLFLGSKEDFTIDQVCDMLGHIHPDSQYLDWLQVGMALKDYGVSFDIWDSWSSRGAKYSGSKELSKKWDSFKGNGITIGSLYYNAKQGGYHPSNYRAATPTLTQVKETITEQFNPETGEIIETPFAPIVRTFPLLYADEIQPVTTSSDFVEDLLRDNEFSVIYGASNCGKTFFMLDLAMHVALGLKWRDRHVEQGGVIYAALEGGHGTKNRIVAFREHYKVQGKIPLAVIPSNINFLDGKGDMPTLLDAIKQAKDRMGGVRMIVIDTLARAIGGGDENSSMDMGQLIINADKIRELTSAHIAFVHHSGKDELRGARGHSSLRAAVDTEIEISRPDTDSPSTIKVVKQREMEMIEDMAFKLERVVLGVNQRGKEVSSCIVTQSEVVVEDRKERLSPIQSWVFDAIVAATDKYGITKTVHKDMPPVLCITYDELRITMEARGGKEFFATEKKTTAEQIKSSTYSARIALQKKGKIGMDAGYIWLI